MKKKILIAAVCIFALPLFSSSKRDTTNLSPFAAVAIAGETTPTPGPEGDLSARGITLPSPRGNNPIDPPSGAFEAGVAPLLLALLVLRGLVFNL